MNRKVIIAFSLIFLIIIMLVGCKDKAEEQLVVDILTSEEENNNSDLPIVLVGEETEEDDSFIDLEIPGLPPEYYSKSSLYYQENFIIEEKWTDGENTRTSIGPPDSPDTAESIFNDQGAFFFILNKDGTWLCSLCSSDFNKMFGDLQGGYLPGTLPPGPGWGGTDLGPGWGNPPPVNGWIGEDPMLTDPSNAWQHTPSTWGDYSGDDLILDESTNSQGDIIRSWHEPGQGFPVRQEFRINGDDIIRNIDEFNTDPFVEDIFVAPDGVPYN